MSTKAPKTSSSSKIPSWLASASKGIVNEAGQLYRNSTYNPYAGQRVAGLAGNEQRALSMAGDPNSFKSYMNPYIEGTLDVAGRKLRENYGRDAARLRGQAVSRGAFGGSRQTLLENGLNENFNTALSDTYVQGMSGAYDRAQQAQNTAFGQLMETGGLDRSLSQAGLDDQYARFREQEDYPWLNLDRYRSMISGVPYTMNSTTTGAKPDLTGQLIGLAGTAAGAFMMSSKEAKDPIGPTKNVAGALAAIPVDRWQYKGDTTEHVGPYAEDFNKAIGKEPGPMIDMRDGIGASIAGVGELHRRVAALEKRKPSRRGALPAKKVA